MYCYYVHTWLTSDDCCEGVFVTLYFLRCRGLKLGLGGASHIADDGVTALEAAAACCGTSWRDHLLDGSPLPPRAWQGRPWGPVCILQTWFVLRRPPRRRVRPRALGVITRPGTRTCFPSGFSSALATPGVPRQAAARRRLPVPGVWRCM